MHTPTSNALVTSNSCLVYPPPLNTDSENTETAVFFMPQAESPKADQAPSKGWRRHASSTSAPVRTSAAVAVLGTPHAGRGLGGHKMLGSYRAVQLMSSAMSVAQLVSTITVCVIWMHMGCISSYFCSGSMVTEPT